MFTRIQYLTGTSCQGWILEKHVFSGDTGNFNENGGWLALILIYSFCLEDCTFLLKIGCSVKIKLLL